MASVHKINQTLAELRGVPLATVEAYSRVLRREAVLPETKRGGAATQLDPVHAGYMLAAIMRGSPIAAAENAREVGELILHDEGALLEPIFRRQIGFLGWADKTTFAQAIGWLIERIIDNAIENFVSSRGRLRIEVDRYWPQATISWIPTKDLSQQYLDGFREAFPDGDERFFPKLRLDGTLDLPMDLSFKSPFLYEAKVTYGVDREKNIAANEKFMTKKKEMKDLDIWGHEHITDRTLIALSEVFKS